ARHEQPPPGRPGCSPGPDRRPANRAARLGPVLVDDPLRSPPSPPTRPLAGSECRRSARPATAPNHRSDPQQTAPGHTPTAPPRAAAPPGHAHGHPTATAHGSRTPRRYPGAARPRDPCSAAPRSSPRATEPTRSRQRLVLHPPLLLPPLHRLGTLMGTRPQQPTVLDPPGDTPARLDPEIPDPRHLGHRPTRRHLLCGRRVRPRLG